MAKPIFTAKAVFNDTPTIKEKCATEEIALATISSWSKTKAGIRRLEIFAPDKSKTVFDAAANYKFTVSAEVCRQLNLRA